MSKVSVNVGNLENQEEILKGQQAQNDLLFKILASVDSLDFNWRKFWAMQQTGHIFTVRKYHHNVSTSCTCEKLDDNAGKVMKPATDIDPGVNDYETEPMFKPIYVNFTVDADGFQHITAVEGDGNFSRTGKNGNVGTMYMPWFVRKVETDTYTDYSVSDTMHEGFIPFKAAVNPDNTLADFMIFSTYIDTGYNGAPSSVSGGKVVRNRSCSNSITYFHTLGNQYAGTTSTDLQFIQLLFMIKYGTTNFQSVMAGTTNYNIQKKVCAAEENVSRVLLSTTDAAAFVTNSYVSVGDPGENTNIDRGHAYMNNLADDVKIIDIQDVEIDGTVYKALTLDAPAFTTTETTYVSTMHWHTGATDSVLGVDGSPVSNTDGKHPCRVGGIEIMLGGYEVLSNVVLDIVTDGEGNVFRDAYVIHDAVALSAEIASVKETYKKMDRQIPGNTAAWKYITEEYIDLENAMSIPTEAEGGGSEIGWADGLYNDGATSGQREALCFGDLHCGSMAGLWFADLSHGVGNTRWDFLARLSANGRRGEWAA